MNIPTDRTQRLEEKNWFICLVVMFAPGIMVIKMSKMAHFLYFLPITIKKSVSVWAKYLNKSERSHLALSENAMDYWVLSYH